MTKDDCKKLVTDIIADIAPDEDLGNLKPDVRLRDQLQLDSMDFLDIVMELRKRHGIEVPEADYIQLGVPRQLCGVPDSEVQRDRGEALANGRGHPALGCGLPAGSLECRDAGLPRRPGVGREGDCVAAHAFLRLIRSPGSLARTGLCAGAHCFFLFARPLSLSPVAAGARTWFPESINEHTASL